MMNFHRALEIKRESHRSFRNLRDAARHLQGRPHVAFGTDKVRASSIAYVRKIEREARGTLPEIERWADEQNRDRKRRISAAALLATMLAL